MPRHVSPLPAGQAATAAGATVRVDDWPLVTDPPLPPWQWRLLAATFHLAQLVRQ